MLFYQREREYYSRDFVLCISAPLASISRKTSKWTLLIPNFDLTFRTNDHIGSAEARRALSGETVRSGQNVYSSNV